MENANDEYDVFEEIWKATEREMQELQEDAEREVGNYLQNRVQRNSQPEWDHVVVAQNLALLHEGLIEWVGLMDIDILVLLYLSTIAQGCLVRADKETGGYKSALITLTWVDGIAVTADTRDSSIMAGTEERLLMRLDLPYADRINSKIKEFYDMACGVRELETLTTQDEEVVKVLFSNI